MTSSEIPSAYVRDKRTPPPGREELRARIPGWGADLDPALEKITVDEVRAVVDDLAPALPR